MPRVLSKYELPLEGEKKNTAKTNVTLAITDVRSFISCTKKHLKTNLLHVPSFQKIQIDLSV